MRTIWVLGNWKQNHGLEATGRVAGQLAAGLRGALGTASTVRVGVAPTYVALGAAAPHCGAGNTDLQLLAQNVAAQESGAFTGEIGSTMLREVGVRGGIVGHSERRAMFGDSNESVGARLCAGLEGGLFMVLCCGERLEDRDAGDHESVVISQLSAALSNVPADAWDRVVIAYEPVWAIGTGRTATPEIAGAMHAAIRGWLAEAHGDSGAGRSILYGGSVKPANAAELIAQDDIDGFLIGGASLDADSLLAIVRHAAAHATRALP